MDKKKKSPLKIVFTVLVAIACVVSVVLVGARCYFRIPVRDYYSISEKTFVIPDCDNGFIAQGIAYDEANEVFFVTGYMKDGSASPIYLVERTDKDNTPESTDTSAESTTETEESRSLSKRVRMIANNGEDLCCHAGGICIKGAYVFIAGGSDHCLYAFSYDESYLQSEKATAVSLTLPLTGETYHSRTLFPFFDGLIPEGWLLNVVSRNWKIDIRDRFGLLLIACRDSIGNVSILEEKK